MKAAQTSHTDREAEYLGELGDEYGAGVRGDAHGSLDTQLVLKTAVLSATQAQLISLICIWSRFVHELALTTVCDEKS